MMSKPKCKKCKCKLEHIPDEIHFHYICPKCYKEYDMDGSIRTEHDV